MTNPETPASVSCTTEIWPTKPVSTTSDRAITVPIRVLISASRKSNGSTTIPTAQTKPTIAAMRIRFSGRGASGSRCSTRSPRLGSRPPRMNIAPR